MTDKIDQSQALGSSRLRLTLRQLEVFVATARAGSTRGAAQQVARSQSAASTALTELEGVLGTQLFDRNGRRLLLNDAGRALLPRAAALLEAAAHLQAQLAGGIAQPLRIAASLTLAEYLLPARIARWHVEHPRHPVHMTVGNTAKVIRAVADRDVQLGFVEGPQTHPDLEVRPWLLDELVIVASPSHPYAHRRANLRELQQAEWIQREPESGTRQAADGWLLPRLGALRVAFEVGSTEAIKRLAAAGAGLACLSRHTVETDVRDGTLAVVKTSLARTRRPLSIVMRRDRAPQAATDDFLAQCLAGN